MFESAEVGNKIDKAVFEQEAPAVRADLLQAQRELATADFSVIVLISGVAGAGKSETVDLLLEWLDARGIETVAMDRPTDEERERPPMWRYWRVLPPKGRMSIFFAAWEEHPSLDAIRGRVSRAEVERDLQRSVDFERMLCNENMLVVKIWLHLSREALKKRLHKLEADPYQSWRVTKDDWKLHKHYEAFRGLAELQIRRTNTGAAPWTIVEGADKHYRHLTVAKTLLAALRHRLDNGKMKAPVTPPAPVQPPPLNAINQLDLSRSLDADAYKTQLRAAEADLNRLTRRLHKEQRSMILVFEGPDAGGKGGAIRRLTAAMDARDYRVISIAAPTDEERAHPYLWRFWRHLPRLGRVTIYDRSWYGRVLVERVEGFCPPADWQRAYTEINTFEEQLTEFGIVLVKFWLAISQDVQLERFQEREDTPYKQYKITPEDWRNRAKWDAYEAAACDMVEKTSTAPAPWTLVEANNKEWARIKVMRTVIDRLTAAFKE